MDLNCIDWKLLASDLDRNGFARTSAILDGSDCEVLRDMYGDDRRFRSRVVMERHRFGIGDYAYFADPLPPLVRRLRSELYKRLVVAANRWVRSCGRDIEFPASMRAMRALSRANGQTKPTPLLLHYKEGGYNCLHRDLYGDLVFPLQAAVFLGSPGEDYEGGEFLLVENRPRSQSIGRALRPGRGEMIVFPSYERPIPGARGFYRAAVRHGVSQVERGERFTLGLIFHDAR